MQNCKVRLPYSHPWNLVSCEFLRFQKITYDIRTMQIH